MRILGIDCGAQRTGYGVIETDGSRHHLVASGLIRMSSRQPLAGRLVEIFGRLRSVIAEFRPEAGAVEEVFAAVNVRSSMVLAHVRGVAVLAIAEAGLEFGEYSALEVKTSVVGYGRAEKSQVQVMVKSLLQLDSTIQSTDVCDALAVAICHATRRSLANLAKITA